MKTFTPKVMANQDRKWFVVDATDKVLGRLATEIAVVLRGKNKATFAPHLDQGDYVVVVNAEKVKLTGNKLEDKMYRKHTGYIGHLREKSAGKVLEETPEFLIENAVAGMIPRNKLKKEMMKRLKVVAGTEHQYEAQQPQALEINA